MATTGKATFDFLFKHPYLRDGTLYIHHPKLPRHIFPVTNVSRPHHTQNYAPSIEDRTPRDDFRFDEEAGAQRKLILRELDGARYTPCFPGVFARCGGSITP